MSMSDRDTLDRLRIAYGELCDEAEMLRYQRDGLRTAARELLARMDSSPERILLEAAIAASEDK
jgi:hypothetical protein